MFFNFDVMLAPAKNGCDPEDEGRYQWAEGTLHVAKIVICEGFKKRNHYTKYWDFEQALSKS